MGCTPDATSATPPVGTLSAWRSRDFVGRRRDIRCFAKNLVSRAPPDQGGHGDKHDCEHERGVVPRNAVKAAEAQLGLHEHRIVVGQGLVLAGLQLFSLAEERHGPGAEARRRRLDLREQNDPSTRGYILAYGGRMSPVGQVNKLMSRARDYLVTQRGIDASRLVVVNGGFREEDSVELWIVPSGASAPLPTPTVQAGEVNPGKPRRKP